MKNALTIDLEDWYQTNDFDFDVARWGSFEDRIISSTNNILALLSRYNVQATFFALGCVAQKHPELIKEITNAGHEIGCHGYWHRMVNKLTREEFRNDLLAAKSILEDVTGKEVKLHRAASWSISSNTLWALQVLEEEGFLCDSSIHPFKTPLYGKRWAPFVPFYPVVGGKRLNLLEFPPTMFTLGKLRIPFAGGLYLRLIPLPMIKKGLAMVNNKHPGMVYIHPWETDVDQPRLSVSPTIKMLHYINLKTTLPKLEDLIRHFNFVPLGELITNNSYPSLPVS